MTNYTKLSMFDFFKMFFSKNDVEWDKIPNDQKVKHTYMLLEYISIDQPEMTNLLNKKHSHVITNILRSMFKHHGKSPGWMYTKVQKTNNKKEISLEKYSPEIVNLFVSVNELSRKDMKSLIDFHPDEVKKFFDEQQKSYDGKK